MSDFFFEYSDGDEVKQPSAVMLVKSAHTERELTKPYCCSYSHSGQWQHSMNEWFMQEKKKSQMMFVFNMVSTAVFFWIYYCTVFYLQEEEEYNTTYLWEYFAFLMHTVFFKACFCETFFISL